MIDRILFVPILVSFLVTLFLLPFWIRKTKQIDLIWEDVNKINGKKVSGSGGIIFVLGFVIGVLLLIAYNVFIINDNSHLVETLALLNVILILASVGFMDDLLGWRKGGLSIRSRLILVLLAAIPLMVINAGKSAMAIPFMGVVDLGIIYPLIIIPLGIMGATTTFNFLAGFNGLEAGQGIILLSSLGIVSYFTGNFWLVVISFCAVSALLAFLIFNFYPASVFPGDSLTYSVGGLIAILSILGNFEKIAVFFFIPVIIETTLKLRGGLLKESFGEPRENGTLGLRYNKIYSLNHISIFLMNKFGFEANERKVVFSIWIFQIIIILIGFYVFRGGIF